jgi:hypothetical protein
MSFKGCGFGAVAFKAGVIVLSVTAALLAGGCRGKFKLIERVAFTPSQNLESVKVSLVFTPRIQTSISGAFAAGSYGYLFVNPYTSSQPFEVGFSLDTDIVNDQDYAQIAPTEVFPNGVPMGIGHALVQIQAADPVSSKFDLYGYVDVLERDWLGSAAIFSFINDQYFPNDLAISQVFLRNDEGKPGVIASVFGPTVDHAGGVKRAGGIALLANVRQLIAGGYLKPGRTVSYRPEATLPLVTGARAGEYHGNYRKLRALESQLVRAFNSHR